MRIDLASGRNVPWLMRTWAQRRPDHPFLVWVPFDGPVRTWTYGAFASETARLASGLRRHGVRLGDRVMVHMDNCPEFLLAWFACAELGATAVCTNTKSTGSEIAYFAEHAGVVAALTQPGFATDVEQAVTNGWVAVTDEPANGRLSFDSLMADADDQPAQDAPPSATTPVSIQYTSGTTARPKAVVWTHANALFGAKASAAHEGLLSTDRQLVHLPLFHTNAQMYSMLATLWVGGTAVLQPRFSASRFWDAAVAHRCTFSSVVPFCTRALATQGDPPANQFRLWGSGVSSPPEAEALGVRTIGWFGMTETVSHCLVDDVEHPGRPGGMGRVAPEYGVRVVDDDGRPVGVDERGHLQVRGVPGLSLFAGYLGAEAATRACFTDDGWFVTGDLAHVHPDGHFTFAGRDKDMMKVGGENVAAAEVEAVIASIDGVIEVAVVGRPHEMLSEVPVAFVIARDPSPALREVIAAVCRERLAAFKVPREVRLVDDLPRSTLNKVAKGQLRDELASKEPGAR